VRHQAGEVLREGGEEAGAERGAGRPQGQAEQTHHVVAAPSFSSLFRSSSHPYIFLCDMSSINRNCSQHVEING
jgi:hypothetical protein